MQNSWLGIGLMALVVFIGLIIGIILSKNKAQGMASILAFAALALLLAAFSVFGIGFSQPWLLPLFIVGCMLIPIAVYFIALSIMQRSKRSGRSAAPSAAAPSAAAPPTAAREAALSSIDAPPPIVPPVNAASFASRASALAGAAGAGGVSVSGTAGRVSASPGWAESDGGITEKDFIAQAGSIDLGTTQPLFNRYGMAAPTAEVGATAHLGTEAASHYATRVAQYASELPQQADIVITSPVGQEPAFMPDVPLQPAYGDLHFDPTIFEPPVPEPDPAFAPLFDPEVAAEPPVEQDLQSLIESVLAPGFEPSVAAAMASGLRAAPVEFGPVVAEPGPAPAFAPAADLVAAPAAEAAAEPAFAPAAAEAMPVPVAAPAAEPEAASTAEAAAEAALAAAAAVVAAAAASEGQPAPDTAPAAAVDSAPAPEPATPVELSAFEKYQEKAGALSDKGAHAVAARLFVESTQYTEDEKLSRKALFDAVASYVKAGMPEEARKNAKTILMDIGKLSPAEAIKLDAILRMT